MAIAVNSTSAAANNTTSVSSVTWAHTCNASDTKLVVDTGYVRIISAGVTGITYNSVALTSGYVFYNPGSAFGVELWYLDSPTTGSSQNIVVTYTDSTTFEPKCGAAGLSGTKPGAFGATTQGNAGSPAITTSISSTTANSMIIDVVVSQVTDLTTPGGSQTQIWLTNNGAGSNDGASSYQLTTITGSYTMSWGGGSAFWQQGVVEVLPAVATVSSSNTLLMMGV